MKAICQCGALSAEISDDAPATTIMCHCIDCQKRTGSPFGMVAYYPRESVKISGEATEYERATDSGSAFTTGFCPQCGSTVYAVPARIPTIIGVTVGTLDGTGSGPAGFSVYEQSRHDWVAVPPGVSRHPRGRDS